MKNKKFLGQILAVMLSLSMAVGAGAADFGTGSYGSLFNDDEYVTVTPGVVPELPGVTPEVSQVPELVTPTPEPGEMPEPTGTITPTPELGEEPEPTETVTPTPEPGEEPEPTETVTPTPEPGEEPEPTETITPTPEVSEAPKPTEVITPTPEVSEAPKPTETVTPTPEVSATPTPTPVPVKISKATVKLSKTTLDYTGKALAPSVTVQYNKTTLKPGVDYTVSYANNKNIGTATVTVKGKGRYTGTKKATFKIVLGAPTVKSAVSAGYNAVKVTWNKVPGAKSYTLYYKGGNVKKWTAAATKLTKTYYTHKSGLTTGTQYTYTVKAVRDKTVSTYGKSTKAAKPVPAQVKLGKVTSAAYNKQKITWSKVAGATGYVVYQKINGNWKSIGSTKELSYINQNSKDHPVKTGVTNTYTVRAYRKVSGKNIYGGYSKTGISGKSLLAKPTISKITKTSKALKLQWKKVAGATGYVVQRYESGKWVIKKTINSSKTLTYTDTTAKKGKTYKYRIQAFCKVNGKPFYSVYSAVKSGKR